MPPPDTVAPPVELPLCSCLMRCFTWGASGAFGESLRNCLYAAMACGFRLACSADSASRNQSCELRGDSFTSFAYVPAAFLYASFILVLAAWPRVDAASWIVLSSAPGWNSCAVEPDCRVERPLAFVWSWFALAAHFCALP